jgi:hypothetical protein
MPTKASTTAQDGASKAITQRRLNRLINGFEAVGARIAFLARTLGIPLHSAADIQQALECDANCSGAKAGTREARMRAELRALLVLRYEVVARMAHSERVGAAAACSILHTANDRLLAKGYDAQAPGMDLRPLFDGIDD